MLHKNLQLNWGLYATNTYPTSDISHTLLLVHQPFSCMLQENVQDLRPDLHKSSTKVPCINFYAMGP